MNSWLFTISCRNDNTSIELEDEPIDWESYAITLKRDPKYHGKLVSMSNDLKFYGEGYDFIKDKYDTYGVQADLTMEILMACDGGWETLPGARINMSSLIFQEGDECTVTANLEDSTCIMKFKNRMDLQVDAFSLSTVDNSQITLADYALMGSQTSFPSIPVIKKIDVEVLPDTISGDYSEFRIVGAGLSGPQYIESFWHLGYTQLNLDELGNSDYSFVRYDTAADVPFVFIAEEASSYLFDISINIQVLVGAVSPIPLTALGCSGPPYGLNELNVHLYLDVAGTPILLDTFTGIGPCFPAATSCDPPDSTSHTSTATYSFSHLLVPGDEVKLYAHIRYGADYDNGTLSNQQIDFCERVIMAESGSVDQWFKVTIFSQFATTTVKTGMVNEALSRIVEKLTGGCLKVYSSYFGRPDAEPYDRETPVAIEDTIGCGALEIITNGLLCRHVGASMFISWNQLFNGLDAIHCLGMGIEDDPHRFVTTYTWDLTDVIALTVIEFPAAVQIIRINGDIVSVGASDMTEYLEELNGISEDIFTLAGVTLSVTSGTNVYGEIEFAPYVIDVDPTIVASTVPAERLRVEKRTFFYEPEAMAFLVDFPTVILRTIRLEDFFIKLSIGYTTWEAEEFNGLDEFNTKRSYTSKQNQIGGELQALSELIGSGYAVEVTRRKWKTTKDWRYDNNIFIICVDTEDHTVVEQGNITSPANILFPSDVYNFRISPARNAIRWFEFLFTMFKDFLDTDNAKLLFTSGEGNYIAEGLVTGGCVPETAVLNESQDLVYTDKSDSSTEFPRLGWEQWQFEYPVEFSDYLIIRDNFYKKIPVRWHGQLEYQEAYIDQIIYRPAQSIASFTLIKAVPVSEEGLCDDNLLLETGLDYLLEDGTCILLEYA